MTSIEKNAIKALERRVEKVETMTQEINTTLNNGVKDKLERTVADTEANKKMLQNMEGYRESREERERLEAEAKQAQLNREAKLEGERIKADAAKQKRAERRENVRFATLAILISMAIATVWVAIYKEVPLSARFRDSEVNVNQHQEEPPAQ